MAKKRRILFEGEGKRIYEILHGKRPSKEEKEYMARIDRWLRSMPRVDGGFSPM